MYTLVRQNSSSLVGIREAVSCMLALVLAEIFFKFHSFTMECLAFLVTWTALSGAMDMVGRQYLKSIWRKTG